MYITMPENSKGYQASVCLARIQPSDCSSDTLGTLSKRKFKSLFQGKGMAV